MRILPELESYRDRLTARASAWSETPDIDLDRDLAQCGAQVGLLDKAVTDLRSRLESSSGPDAERISHRLAIQEQTRDLTAAYAEALRRTLDQRRSGNARGASS